MEATASPFSAVASRCFSATCSPSLSPFKYLSSANPRKSSTISSSWPGSTLSISFSSRISFSREIWGLVNFKSFVTFRRDMRVKAEMFGQLTSGLEAAWSKLKGEGKNDHYSEKGVQKEEKGEERTKEKEKEREKREKTYLVYHRRKPQKKWTERRTDPPHPHSGEPAEIPTRKKTNISPEEREDLRGREKEGAERVEADEEEEEVKEEEEDLKDVPFQREVTSLGSDEGGHPQKLYGSLSGGGGPSSIGIIEPSTLLSPWQKLEREALNADEGEEGVASGNPRDPAHGYPGDIGNTRPRSTIEMSGPDSAGPSVAQIEESDRAQLKEGHVSTSFQKERPDDNSIKGGE